MKPVSGVAPEILTALPRADGGAVEPSVAPLQTRLAHGTFGYSIPLESAPDRGASRLQLAIDYDPRRNGNGVFGTGWGLSLPFIERRLDRGTPRYDASDKFATSDGARLEPVGGGEYRPLVERDFRRIRYLGDRWEVLETDGSRLIFGEDQESRLFDPAHPQRVAAWYLARREDPNGNVVRYRYLRDTAVKRPEGYVAAQMYLRQIEYVIQPSGENLCAVRFDYDTERPDAWTSYRRGFPVRTSWLCRQVISFTTNIDGGPARVIDFGGVPWDAAANDSSADDLWVAWGLYVRSRCADRSLEIEWPTPLSQVTLDLAVPGTGARYRIIETAQDGRVTSREENANPGYRVQLGSRVRSVRIEALNGPLVVARVTLPGGQLPEVFARYRLGYGPVLGEAQVDLARLAPPTRLLAWVERAGYDDAFKEELLPRMRMEYRPLSLTGIYPRPLSGTPAEPLGWQTTPLSFFGTGRPDLIQTSEGHRVYLNRGRVGAEIVVDRRDLTESPSAQIGDRGVFLRDIEGLGAVDLTTVDYFYRNPSKLGAVSRTAPTWGAAVQFDPTQRHPQLSTSELERSRSIDLDSDGRIDLLTTADDLVEWTNLGDGGWSAARRVPRSASFGDKLFPDVSFDDAAIFIADLNGDGSDEIVRVSARKIEYWARSGDRWGFKTTMAGSPRWAEFDPDRVVLADLTGNGAADVVYLTGNGVELAINLGGTRFAPRIPLDFRDEGLSRGIPMPVSGAAALVVDLLGDGTRGLLWSFARADIEPNYFFLPLCASGKPYLLAALENGTGGRIELEYTTSSVLAAQDEAQGRPWTDEPPYPVTVVTEVREIDRVLGNTLIRRFRYSEGFYDREDRELRGFAIVEETVLGNAARRGGRIVHVFGSGKPASEAAADRAQARAIAGTELSTSHFDLATGVLLGRVDRQVEVSLVREFTSAGSSAVTDPVVTGGGEYIAFAWERRRLESAYEGTSTPRRALWEATREVSLPDGTALDEYGRVISETAYGEVVAAGAGGSIATFEIDGATLGLRVADPDRQRRSEYRYAENRAAHIVRNRCSEVTWGGAAFNRLLAEKRIYFDGGTAADDYLPIGQVSQGNVQREETLVAGAAELQSLAGLPVASLLQDGMPPAYLRKGIAADGTSSWFAVPRRRIFVSSSGRIAYGAVAQDIGVEGLPTVRVYDSATWFLRQQRNALGHVTDHQSMCYRAAKPQRTLLPNGAITVTTFDALGRETSVTEDSGAAPAPQVLTQRDTHAFDQSGMPTAEIRLRLIDTSESPRRYVEERRYVDGWGRLIQIRRSSESHGSDYVVTDHRYDAGGTEASFDSNPYFDPGAGFRAPAAGQQGLRRERDAMMRIVGLVFPDGSRAELEYGPWQVKMNDPEDLNPGSPHASTPTVCGFDYGRRLIEISTTVRHGDGFGSEALATTRYAYDAADHLIRITDPMGTVTEVSWDARGNVLRSRHADAGDIIRLFNADSRRIYQRNAIGEEWWYAYDAIGRLSAEIPGANPAQPAQVKYTYDSPGVNSVGRLVSGEDLAGGVRTDYGYDARGNLSAIKRRIGGSVVADDVLTYNDLREVSRRTFATGVKVEHQRGIDGLESAVSLVRADRTKVPLIANIVYYPSGRVESAQLSGGAVRYQASLDAQTQRITGRRYSDAAGAVAYEIDQLTYDSVGNILGLRENAPTAAPLTWALAYDSLYRLRQATGQRPAGVVAAFEYRYDLAGNPKRSDEVHPGQMLVCDPIRPDELAGVAGAPAEYTYDAAGRLAAAPGFTTVRWSSRNRVDRLVAQSSPRLDLVYDQDGEIIRLTRKSAAGTDESLFPSLDHEKHGGTHSYFAFIDGLQSVAAHDDGTCVVLARGIAGSVVRLIDQAGVAVAGSTELYGPFGSTIEAPAAPWPRGYAGALRAPHGMYLMGVRPYLSGVGRFGAPDPILLDRLDPEILKDPRRLNPYAYALGNPQGYVDPTGRLALIDDIIFYVIGWALGLRSDSFFSGVGQNFVESWSVLLRTVVPFHSGASLAESLLQSTWGLPNQLLGTIAGYGSVELFGAKTEMRGHVQIITVPNVSFGAFTLGNKVIGDAGTLQYVDPGTGIITWRHEQGHYFQNLLLGPLYLAVIGLPSIIHAGLHDILHPKQNYFVDFYTESWATAWGK